MLKLLGLTIRWLEGSDMRKMVFSLALMLGFFFALPTLPASAQFPDFVELSQRLKPAVVNISTTKLVKPGRPMMPGPRSPQDEFFEEFFDRFFRGQPQQRPQRSLGSGFIITADGFIITNNHVVEGADEITVRLTDGRSFRAEIRGLDPMLDVALLKIDAADLPVAELGDSDKLQVGEWVLAIGNPFGLEETVTAGIVSAKERVIGAGPYDSFIQTDASINPGNSGGPLFNIQGKVIGINTAIVSTGQGIGFAIPINAANHVVAQLKEFGEVIRGWLGVGVQGLTEELAASFGLEDTRGALVSEVMENSPAAEAGLQRGDVIRAYSGRKVDQVSDLPRMVANTPVGERVQVSIVRDGKPMELQVTIARLEDERRRPEVPTVDPEALGLTVSDVTPEAMHLYGLQTDRGALVTDVDPAGVAAVAGIRAGDLLLEINGREIPNAAFFRQAVQGAQPGDSLRILVQRGDNLFFTALKKP
jgi:serine protease Do